MVLLIIFFSKLKMAFLIITAILVHRMCNKILLVVVIIVLELSLYHKWILQTHKLSPGIKNSLQDLLLYHFMDGCMIMENTLLMTQYPVMELEVISFNKTVLLVVTV